MCIRDRDPDPKNEQPSAVYASSIEQIRKRYKHRLDLEAAGKMFLALDLFSIAVARPNQASPVIADATMKLKELYPKEQNAAPMDIATYSNATRELAGLVGFATSPGPFVHNGDLTPALEKVGGLFELVHRGFVVDTRGGSQPPSEADVRRAERFHIAHTIRFAAGLLGVEGNKDSGLMNCSPNGANFLLVPTLALRIVRGLPPGASELERSIWLSWTRAAIAGLEIYMSCAEINGECRVASRLGAPRRIGYPAFHPGFRNRIRSLTNHYRKLDLPKLQDRYMAMVRLTGLDSTTAQFSRAFTPYRVGSPRPGGGCVHDQSASAGMATRHRPSSPLNS